MKMNVNQYFHWRWLILSLFYTVGVSFPHDDHREQRWRQTHLGSFSSTSAIFFFWHQLLISACELLSEGQRVNTRKVEAAQPKSNFPSENEFSYCLISRVLTGLLIWQHSVFHREESKKKSEKNENILCNNVCFFPFFPVIILWPELQLRLRTLLPYLWWYFCLLHKMDFESWFWYFVQQNSCFVSSSRQKQSLGRGRKALTQYLEQQGVQRN